MKKFYFSLVFGVLFSFVYFVFFSKSLYRTGYIIHLYYPGAIVFGIGIIFLLNNKFWNLKRTYFIATILGLIISIFIIPLLFDIFLGVHLRNLYAIGYDNLLDVFSYYTDVIKNNHNY